MSNHVPPCSPPLSGRILHQVTRVYQLEEKELRSAGQSRKLSEARAMIGMLGFRLEVRNDEGGRKSFQSR